MTRDQIAAWAAVGESDTQEFKSTTGERCEAAQTVCAMLNHRGGRVLIGIDPAGRVAGQMVSDKTVEDVVGELRRIDPPVFPVVERVPVGGDREVIVVTTGRGPVGPYSYKGVAFKRVGNTSLAMSRDEYNRALLERMHGEVRWENQPAAGWAVADLDHAEIARTLDEGVRRGRIDPGTAAPADVLRGLGLVKDGVLLRAAVVLFGKPERFAGELPQCLLKLARFKGIDRSEFLDNRQYHGNAFDLLARAERFLSDTLPIAGKILPGLFERVDDPLYPRVALREAVANAFCHRDYGIGGGSVALAVYDDRLEITSAGGLHFGLTPAALFEEHPSLPWNPLIAGAFYRRGVIEQWGRGTLKIADLTARAGLPRPEIEDQFGCVTVRFRPSRYVPPSRVGHDLSVRQRQILAVLGTSAEPLALREIVERIPGSADDAVRADLQTLRTLGLAALRGHGRGARWRLAGGQ